MIKFIETEKEIIKTELDDFENELDMKLPESYKEHILKFNGGYPEDELYFKGYPIDSFGSIKYGDDTVEENLETFSDVVQGKFLPFGDSLSGVLYISLNDKDYGKIYVTYSDGQTDFLANSFKEFMDGLSEEQEL